MREVHQLGSRSDTQEELYMSSHISDTRPDFDQPLIEIVERNLVVQTHPLGAELFRETSPSGRIDSAQYGDVDIEAVVEQQKRRERQTHAHVTDKMNHRFVYTSFLGSLGIRLALFVEGGNILAVKQDQAPRTIAPAETS